MDRLTYKNKSGRFEACGDMTGIAMGYDGSSSTVCGNVVDRLAAYEDTGLEPEGITNLREKYDAAIKALSGAILGQKETPHWIPVSERLPEHSNDVLIYAKSTETGEPLILLSAYCEKTLGGQFLGSKGWAEPFPYFSHDYTITHWQPLPQPPKGAK